MPCFTSKRSTQGGATPLGPSVPQRDVIIVCEGLVANDPKLVIQELAVFLDQI